MATTPTTSSSATASTTPAPTTITSESNDVNIAKPGTIGYLYDFLDKTIKECSDARNYVIGIYMKNKMGVGKKFEECFPTPVWEMRRKRAT
jgi:hypothetical protein